MEDSTINSTNQTVINMGEEKSVFERAIIEAFKQKHSKEIYEKLSIAADEIKFMVNETKRSHQNDKFLLNKNIIDKISRIVERQFFNVNILIAKIFESLLDPNHFPLLSSDVNLLINFSNEVLNLLELIKSTIVSRQLEKRCSSFLNFLLSKEGVNEEQKQIILDLLKEFPTRNSSQVYKTFDEIRDRLLKLCRNQSVEDKMEGINQLMDSFGNTASLEEQFDLLIEKVPAIVKAVIHQPNPEFKEAYFQLGNFICSILYATKFKVDAFLPEYKINHKDINKNFFFLIAGDELVDEVSKYEVSFLHNTVYELVTQKEMLTRCENIFQICNLILNTLAIYDSIFDLQFVCYIILKRIYFTFPQFRRNIEDLVAVTLVNLCSFQDQFEVDNSEECRVFLNFLITNGEEELKAKINKRVMARSANIQTKEEMDEKELLEVEYEYLKLADFNLRIGYPSSQEIEAGNEMSKYIEVLHPNSLIYIGYATHSNDVTFHLMKYIPNDECEDISIDERNESEEEEDEAQKANEEYTDKGHFKLLLKLEKIDSSINPVKIVLFVPEPGTYKLVFDNTYSWFTSKTLRYRVSVLKPLSEVDVMRRVDFDKLRSGNCSSKRDNVNTCTVNKDTINATIHSEHENKILMVKIEGTNRVFSLAKIHQSAIAIKDTDKYHVLPVILTKDTIRIFRTDEHGVSLDEFKEISLKANLEDESEVRNLPEAFEEEMAKYISSISNSTSKSIFLSAFIMEKLPTNITNITNINDSTLPITEDEFYKSTFMKLGFFPESLLDSLDNVKFFVSSLADSCLLFSLYEKVLKEESFGNIIHIHFDKMKTTASLYFEGVINDKISGLSYDHSKSLVENVGTVIEFVTKVTSLFGNFELSVSYSDIDEKLFEIFSEELSKGLATLEPQIPLEVKDAVFLHSVLTSVHLFQMAY